MAEQVQLPAFLRGHAQQLATFNEQATAGINNFQAPHRISIRGSRFHLVDPNGVETDVVENYGVALDVIVVDVNPGISKIFYAGAYDPNATEPAAPTCYSDNGVGPSQRAGTPQAPTCAVCPMNAWGSKITPTGSQIKACSDVKKLAVLLANNPTGPVYMLPVPAASLKPWVTLVDSCSKFGVPVPAVVIGLEFDTTASYPKLKFVPRGYVSEAQWNAASEVLDSEETAEILGKDDKPVDPARIAAPRPGAALPPPPSAPIQHPSAPPPAAPVVPPPAAAPMASPPAAALQPAVPLSPQPVPTAPPPGMPPHTAQALAAAPATVTRPKRRTRSAPGAGTAPAAAPAAPAVPSPAPAAPVPPGGDPLAIPGFLARPYNPSAAGTTTAPAAPPPAAASQPVGGATPIPAPAMPPATSAEMDAMLANIMGPPQ